MRRLTLGLALWLAASSAFGQMAGGGNAVAPTPATADNSDRIATTAYVQNVLAGGLPLAAGTIFIGNGSNLATSRTMSGDCTISQLGVIVCTQAAGNFNVVGNLTVGGIVIDTSGNFTVVNIAAPASPAAGKTIIYSDSTTKVLTFKNDAGTVGNAVVPDTGAANNFLTGISSAGVITKAAIAANSVTRAMEAQGLARSVIGVTGNATANVADIQGTANQALVVNSAGTALSFGQVNLASSAAVIGALPLANGGLGSTTLATAQANIGYPTILGGFANNVNFNSANTDTSIAITSPTANYRINNITIVNTGTTASLTTATYGVFTAATGGGSAIVTSGSVMSGITSNAANTGVSLLNAPIALTAYFNLATIFYRQQTAQGAAATGSVYVFIQPLP